MVYFEWLEVSYSAFQKKNVVHLKIASNAFHAFHCVLYWKSWKYSVCWSKKTKL